MKTWLKGLFIALAVVFTISFFLYMGTVFSEICKNLWVSCIAATVVAAVLYLGYLGGRRGSK